MSGNLSAGGDKNFFDPAFNGLPTGYGNSPPNPPVDIAVNDTKVEFGFSDNGLNLYMADLTTNGVVTIQEFFPANFLTTDVGPHKYILTSSSFSGLTLTNISNTFPTAANVVPKLTGNTLTVDVISAYSVVARPTDATFEFKLQLQVSHQVAPTSA